MHVDSVFKNFGNGIPRDLFSMQNGFDLFNRKIRINAMFDYKGGYNTQDGANNFQCNSPPQSCRETQDPTAPLDMQARAIAKTYGTTLGGTTYKSGAGYFINGQFWKFREFSAVVSLPDRLNNAIRAQSGSNIVFGARNLHLWTKFTGIDPEANYGAQRQRNADRVPDRRGADVFHRASQPEVLTPTEDDIMMMKMQSRARWGLSVGAVAAVLIVMAACTDFKNQLLEPQNPGLIDPGAVGSPAAAMALKVGAMGRIQFVVDCGGNSECLWEEAGSLADEYHNSDFQNTRQDIDQRQIDDGNGTVAVGRASRRIVDSCAMPSTR